MKPTVAILLPTLGRMEAVLHDWLILTGGSGKYDLRDIKTYSQIPHGKAFCSLHKQFLESDADYAFVLNDDEMPPMDALERLIEHDKDIVSCVAFKWTEERGPMPTTARWDRNQGIFVYHYGTGLERVDRCGSSGMLVKREVLETLPLGIWKHQSTSECKCGFVDHLGSLEGEQCPRCGNILRDEGTMYISPEFILEDHARAAGFEIWVDFTLRMHHYKNVDLLRVNDLMVQARLEGRHLMKATIEKMRGAGCSDEEIVNAMMEVEG